MQPVWDFVVDMMRVTRQSICERLLEEQSRKGWYRRRGSLGGAGEGMDHAFKRGNLGPGQLEPNITVGSPNELRARLSLN
jgi:hypothetical protein